MKQVFFAAVAAAVLVLILAYFGVARSFGAHPWWSFDVALYGIVPGLLLTLVLARLPRAGIYWAAADLALAAFIAWWGKRAFVASSGDNSFAGSLWFFGWIAVCACLIAVLALAVIRLRRLAD